MVSDAEARKAVRQFMKSRDLQEARLYALVHVLVRKDRNEYEKLLEASERFIPFVTRLLEVGNDLQKQVYAGSTTPTPIGLRRYSPC